MGSVDETISTNRRHLAIKLRNAIIDRECAISRQNSTSSREFIESDPSEKNSKISENCQIRFIENLVEIGRKLVSQPDRDSKTQRLGLVKHFIFLKRDDFSWKEIACKTFFIKFPFLAKKLQIL